MASFVQTLKESVDQRRLGHFVKINHDVSAENNVKSITGWRRIHQVKSRKLNHIPDVFLDAVMTVPSSATHLKILLQHRGRILLSLSWLNIPLTAICNTRVEMSVAMILTPWDNRLHIHRSSWQESKALPPSSNRHSRFSIFPIVPSERER